MLRCVSIIRSSSGSCLLLAKITLLKTFTGWFSYNLSVCIGWCADQVWNLVCSDKAKMTTRLIMCKYWTDCMKLFTEKASTLPQQLVPPSWLHLIEYCQAVYIYIYIYIKKVDLNLLPTLTRFGSQWLLALSKIKVHLEGMTCSGHYRFSGICDVCT